MSISWIEKKITKEKFIITENGKYTFEEFFDLIIQYYSFAKKNINSKERVCFISNHVIQYAIFSNIIPMLGGIFVPLNPKSPKEEIESKMNLIGSKKIIYDESIEIPNIKNIYKLKAKKSISKNVNFIWPNEDESFCILFTSGSSGTAKAVSISRKNIESSCKASQENLNVSDKDVWLLCMPPYHAGGLSIIFRSIILSKKFYALDTFDPNIVIDLIIQSKVSIISLVPTMLVKILDIMEKNRIKAPENFNFVLCGGAKVNEELIIKAKKFNIKVLPTYGMTEATSQIATANPDDLNRPSSSVGKVLNNISIKFTDKKELQINGPNLAKYINKKNNEWLKTGDFGYINKDGYLFIEGRIDELIVSGGENINPSELEFEVNKIPEIKECYVFGTIDKYWGQKVNLYVNFKDKNNILSLTEIKKSLSHMDNFKLPKVLHISSTEIPKLNNGKIDRKRIEELINE